jgi:prolyl-tRNA synthetase
VFDVTYLGADGEHHLAHQTSWGMSWRSVGALIMAHGDDNGLRLPPNVAPIQVVIVPIYKDENKDTVLAYAREVAGGLSGMRVHVDEREGQTPGFKFNEWEVKGVPVRLEIGGKEADEQALTMYRRDTGVKEKISADGAKEYIEKLFVDIHETLYNQAYEFLRTHIHRVESIDDIDDRIGFFEASWSETPESEKMLKERFAMVSRVLPRQYEDAAPKNAKCFITGEPAKHDWYFAKSY